MVCLESSIKKTPHLCNAAAFPGHFNWNKIEHIPKHQSEISKIQHFKTRSNQISHGRKTRINNYEGHWRTPSNNNQLDHTNSNQLDQIDDNLNQQIVKTKEEVVLFVKIPVSQAPHEIISSQTSLEKVLQE